MPKSETNPKSEEENPKWATGAKVDSVLDFLVRYSIFEFVSDLGIRISDFRKRVSYATSALQRAYY
jgi:hypothetical protein